MKALTDLVAGHEEWLMSRVLRYAKERNYTKYTSTLPEAWRISISGLSDALLSALQTYDDPPELGPDDDYSKDPIASFGILEAQRHRTRGVTLGMFLSLMKYYRQSYVDLVVQAGFERETQDQHRLFVERFFDRVELGFCVEWASTGQAERIDELQSANRQMTNEKNKYLTAFESMHDPILLLNREGRVENLNHAASEAFVGRTVPGSQYYSRKSGGRVPTWLAEELSGDTNGVALEHEFEKQLATESGMRHYQIKLKRMLDVSEKFSGTVVIFNDITEAKRARELEQLSKRQEDEARLTKEIEAVGLVVDSMLRGETDDAATERRVLDACLDTTDSQYGMIGAINEQGNFDTACYGGRTVEDCAFPEALAWQMTTGMAIRGVWGWPLKHGRPLLCNDPKGHPDSVGFPEGHVPILSFLGVPLMVEGQVTGMMAVANKPGGYRDEDKDALMRLAAVMMVSKQHRIAVSDLQRSERHLHAANKELEAFAYSVSHDLRSPLRAMDGFSERLLSRYGNELDDNGRHHLERIRAGSHWMGVLIDGLLRLSRIARQTVKNDTVDLGVIAREIIEEIRRCDPERDVDVDIGKHLNAEGDGVLLRALLDNLLGNAWKFTSKTSGARIEFGAKAEEAKTVYYVRDNGAGFDMAYADKLFGPFQRLYAEGNFPGTGIGLATVQRIVRCHGGKVWAEGAPAQGPTFYFTLNQPPPTRR